MHQAFSGRAIESGFGGGDGDGSIGAVEVESNVVAGGAELSSFACSRANSVMASSMLVSVFVLADIRRAVCNGAIAGGAREGGLIALRIAFKIIPGRAVVAAVPSSTFS